MSRWVYVAGIVKAETYAKTSAEAMYIGQTTIAHLPRVYGSERNANLHAYLEDGYNSWSSHDEYNCFSNLFTGKFHTFENQSKILVTISGSLRDRTFDESFRETTAMLCRMAKYISIDRCAVHVEESYGKSAMITNKNGWLGALYEGFWA